MPRRYNPDHTIEIRRRLWMLVVGGVVGLLLAGAAVGVTALATVSSDEEAAGLSRAGWIFAAILAVVSLLHLVTAAIGWLVYQRRRAELDAAGAEISGEIYARLDTLPREDRPRS